MVDCGASRHCCMCATLQQCLEAPQSTISQHLAKMRAVGIIEGERNGLEVVYRLKSRAVEQLLEGLFCKEKDYHDMG